MKKHTSLPVFKPYTMNQMHLMPQSYAEKIPAGHLVRLVNEAIETLDLEILLAQYGLRSRLVREYERLELFNQQIQQLDQLDHPGSGAGPPAVAAEGYRYEFGLGVRDGVLLLAQLPQSAGSG